MVLGLSSNIQSPSWEYKGFCFSPSYYNFLLAGYHVCSAGFTYLFILVHLQTFFETWFCTGWVWGHLLGQLLELLGLWWPEVTLSTKLTLATLKVNPVHIEVTTDQLFLDQGSWWILNLIDICGTSWHETHTTQPSWLYSYLW